MKHLFFSVLSILGAYSANAQLKPEKMTPESSELWDPEPRLVTPGKITSATSGTTAPSDALVLFDGTNLDQWVSSADAKSPATFTVANGAMTVAPRKGGIQTREEFGDFQLHVEWRSPSEVKGNGQGRGNSGIFLQGIYEVQVLDSHQNRTYANGQAGSIYKQTPPLVNPVKAPGEWQSYDILYTAPRFNKDGMIVVPAYVTVILNGVVVQNHTQIQGTTPYVGRPLNTPHGKGPISLQDHGDLVSFRNIWIREL